jgi:glycosyltransferase involved in cell wall biosynthesis
VASFTGELSRVTPDREVVALHPNEPISPYPFEVHHRIRRDERADYARTAKTLSRCADVASVQFERSIWGGEHGAYALDFVEALPVPYAVTLHGVRHRPDALERSIVFRLVDGAGAALALSSTAAATLVGAYGIAPGRIAVVPHGVPDLPIMDAASGKAAVGLAGRAVILGIGLLAPGKGFERVIEVLPAIRAIHANVTFAIVGTTHPDVHQRDGELYRRDLAALAARLGVAEAVRFVDDFVGRVDLTRWLQAADVVVTLYDDLHATDSGIVAYAMGAGRPVISSRFPYAVDELAYGRGALVSRSTGAVEAALLRWLPDSGERAAMGQRAHQHSRDRAWTLVGSEYERRLAAMLGGPRSKTAAPAYELANG